MDKLLTIVIPTYNMEKYLDKCLTSLIVDDNKLMERIEILVVIDGAKDRSSEIAHAYQNRYPLTFRVIDKENGNYGSCVNRGLKEASGKYIKILDADDYFDNQVFLSYLVFLQESDADVVITNYSTVSMSYEKTYCFSFSLSPRTLLPISKIASTQDLQNIEMHAITYKKSIFDGLDYQQNEGISYTDQEWMFTPLFRAKTILYFDSSLYQYLLGREGQTMDYKTCIKNISHSMIGLRTMIDSFNKYSYSADRELLKYFCHRINRRAYNIYYRHLMCINGLDLRELKKLDEYICNNALWCIRYLNSLKTVLGYRFVNDWRQGNWQSKSLKLRVVNWLVFLKEYFHNVVAKIRSVKCHIIN